MKRALAAFMLGLLVCSVQAVNETLNDPNSGVVDLVTLRHRLIEVQPGDVFYLTASGPQGDAGLTVDLDNGEYGMAVRTGERLRVAYYNPGEYIITSDANGNSLPPVTVRVIAPPKPQSQTEPAPSSALRASVSLMATTSSGIGGSIGSVYAGDYVNPDGSVAGKFPVRVVVSSAGTFSVTRYGTSQTWSWTFITPGETNDVIDGPKGGESLWTLVKSGNSGTHVLSTNSPYKLHIENILMVSGPASVAQPGARLANSNITVCINTPIELAVEPGPGWASNNIPKANQLYDWKVDSTHVAYSVVRPFSFPAVGTYYISVSCHSPDTTPVTQGLTVNVIDVDIDADLNADGSFDEDNPEEATAPGLLLPVNSDDDGVPAGQDASNNQIDTVADKADMQVLKLRRLLPSSISGGTVILTVSDKTKIRIFDQTDTAKIGPAPGPDAESCVIPLSLITASDLDYLVEGVAPGNVTVTLVYKNDSGLEVSHDELVITVYNVDFVRFFDKNQVANRTTRAIDPVLRATKTFEDSERSDRSLGNNNLLFVVGGWGNAMGWATITLKCQFQPATAGNSILWKIEPATGYYALEDHGSFAEGDTADIKLTTSQDPRPNHEGADFALKVGIDRDHNDVLSPSETFPIGWNIRTIGLQEYKYCADQFPLYMTLPGSLLLPHTLEFLNIFLGNSFLPTYSSDNPDTVAFTGAYDQKNGLGCDPISITEGSLRRYTWKKAPGSIRNTVLVSDDLWTAVIEPTIAAMDIAGWYSAPANASQTTHTFTRTFVGGVVFDSTDDLQNSLNGATATFTIDIKTKRTTASPVIKAMKVTGKVTDLYDFRTQGVDEPFGHASRLQTCYAPSMERTKGKIYNVLINCNVSNMVLPSIPCGDISTLRSEWTTKILLGTY